MSDKTKVDGAADFIPAEQPNEAGSEGLEAISRFVAQVAKWGSDYDETGRWPDSHDIRTASDTASKLINVPSALQRAVAAKGASKVAVDDPLWCPICNTRHLFGTACRLPAKGAIPDIQERLEKIHHKVWNAQPVDFEILQDSLEELIRIVMKMNGEDRAI